MVARTLTMPVVASTVFSIIAIRPTARLLSPGMIASTDGTPSAIASRSAGSESCGIGNVTYTGAVWMIVAIGVRSAERTKLPTLTEAALMRPLIGAVIRQ